MKHRQSSTSELQPQRKKGPLRLFNYRRKDKGQSAVEFALISFFLFVFLLGILETARLLFVFSVVSNAAQEGSRYGIIRPRDAVPSSLVTYSITGPTYRGVPIPTQVVVSDGLCNVVEKTQEKVWGIKSSDVKVRFWYDNGNGTPVAVNSIQSDARFYDRVILPGNRMVVEASYRFDFIVPFFSVFAPNGINVNMTSARTMMNDGSRPIVNCITPYRPGPTFTPVPTPTNTPTNTPTATATNTATNTATATSTNTSTATNTATATRTATNTPTRTSTPTSTATLTRTPTLAVPTPVPTAGQLDLATYAQAWAGTHDTGSTSDSVSVAACVPGSDTPFASWAAYVPVVGCGYAPITDAGTAEVARVAVFYSLCVSLRTARTLRRGLYGYES